MQALVCGFPRRDGLEDRMSSGRMRRVDEAIRQVLGDAVAGELKDPRVGFVTVTDVRTSADLRHARVYVSVLDRAALLPSTRSARPRSRACAARTATCRARLATRAAPEAHADARVRLRRDDRPRVARRRVARRDRGLVSADRIESTEVTRERVLERIREDSHFVLAAHERPDGDALGSLVGMQGLLSALGKDSHDVHRAGRPAAALRVPLLPARRPDPRAAAGHRRAHRRVPGLRQHRPQLGAACCATAGTC